jgi:Acyl dehydratase
LSKNPFQPGDKVTFSKTVSETDVYMFAGITGDFSPNHTNEEFMKTTPFKTRIVHGALLVGFISTASYLMIEKKEAKAVNYGFNKIRFIKPVYFGDTITVHYRIDRIEDDGAKAIADVQVVNQDGTVCAVAENILYAI